MEGKQDLVIGKQVLDIQENRFYSKKTRNKKQFLDHPQINYFSDLLRLLLGIQIIYLPVRVYKDVIRKTKQYVQWTKSREILASFADT